MRKEEENRRVIALRKKKIRRLTFSRVLTPNAAVDRPPAPPHRKLISPIVMPSLLSFRNFKSRLHHFNDSASAPLHSHASV